MTTPIGTWRYSERSEAYSARVPSEKRTSPSIARTSSPASSRASTPARSSGSLRERSSITASRRRCRQRAFQRGATLASLLDVERGRSAALGHLHEIDRCEVDAVLGVADEDHLLPLDEAERVVLEHDLLDRQFVLHERRQIAHLHR